MCGSLRPGTEGTWTRDGRFPLMHRLVISLELPDGHFHALGHVSRVERGDDFRTYVAMNFVHVRDEEFDELLSRLDTLDHERLLQH